MRFAVGGREAEEMRQRVFTSIESVQPILECAQQGIDRIVLRGEAVEFFHSSLGALWHASVHGGEVLPEDIEEIQGTSIMNLARADLGVALGYAWDYIRKEPGGVWPIKRISLAEFKEMYPDNERPLAKCSNCGRKSWAADEVEKICDMPQPSGLACRGRMESNAKAR